MTYLDEFVHRYFPNAKRRGRGYMACCPCPGHNDRVESLSISDDANGNILLNCFAGCSHEDILYSIGCVKMSGPKRGQADWSALYSPESRERYKRKSDFERKKKNLKREWLI